MSEDNEITTAESEIYKRLVALEPTHRQRVLRKIIGAALGAIPWVGGFFAASVAFKDETAQLETNQLGRQWLEEHGEKIENLARALAKLSRRLENFADDLTERLESDEYLQLIRKGFRIWDESDTEEKREYVAVLLANAGGIKLCDDDLVRLFLDWLERYHEAHFKVIRAVFQRPGSTRRGIWTTIYPGGAAR